MSYAMKLDDRHFGDWTSCVVCGGPTKAAATHNDLGGRYRGIPLCSEHMTIENVIAKIQDIARVIYS